MNLQQFFIILFARRREALYTLLGTVAVTIVLSLVLPTQYKASTDIVIDVKSPDPVAGMVLPALVLPGYMATQVDIINSDRVAWRVVKLLKLDENADIKQQWQDETEGKGTIENWLAKLLQKKLDVKPSRESNVVTISYKAGDPKFAAALANAFAQAYIDTNIELQVEPARQYAKWFQEQGRTAREQLGRARASLSDYQQKSGIVAADQRLDAEVAKLNDLTAQLTLSQTQSADAQSKQKAAAGDTLPEVMQSPLIQGLKSNIAQLEGKLHEMAGNLGHNHPQYKRTEAELASMKQQLDAETRRIGESVTTTSRISRGKETELRAAIEEQKQKILQLNAQRDQVLVLQQEADNAQKAYDAVAQRQMQSEMQSKMVQTNVSVLTPAAEPIDPSFPRIGLNLLLAVFLGGMLGIGVALAKETMNRRIRSGDDVTTILELPVLALVEKPQAKSVKWWQRIPDLLRARRPARLPA
jgi:chain length determinant protein EpsF